MQIKKITSRLNSEIKNKLEERELQQKEYAKEISISESTFSNYVRGTREMPYEVLARIANDLDIDLNYIFKTEEKRRYPLSGEEELFYKALKGLPENERQEIYRGLNLLMKYRNK